MRELDDKHLSAEAMDESGRLGYEFYRQEILSFEFCVVCSQVRTHGLVAPHSSILSPNDLPKENHSEGARSCVNVSGQRQPIILLLFMSRMLPYVYHNMLLVVGTVG